MCRPKHVEWTCREINFTAHCSICWLFHRIEDTTKFSFINLFKSALHVSGNNFAHSQEHFLIVYSAFVTIHRSAAVSVHCTKSYIYSQKCSWGWANLSPETCRADLKRLINEKFFASCWLLTSLCWWCAVTQTSTSIKIHSLCNYKFKRKNFKRKILNLSGNWSLKLLEDGDGRQLSKEISCSLQSWCHEQLVSY